MMHFTRSLAVLLALAVSASAAPHTAATSIDPARTRALVVGVLSWKNTADWSSFDTKNRRDQRLIEHLRSRGVSTDRITYLQDKQVTLAGVRKSLATVLEASQPGETLIFYYCGHGFLDAGHGYFANYDAGAKANSWLPMREIYDTIDAGFHGDRVFLIADCCHSGRLAEDVAKAHPRVAVAVFASSSADDSSTGNWTFSQAVLDALSGNPLVDRDHDGKITAQELARYTEDEMTLFEEQLASSTFAGGFDPGAVLASAVPAPSSPRYGERVKVLYNKEYWTGRIMEVKDDQALIRWVSIGFDSKNDDEWVPLSTVKTLKLVQHPVGTRLEVRWKKHWYPAKVVAVQGSMHQVHYDGYETEDDEWVPPARIRTARSK